MLIIVIYYFPKNVHEHFFKKNIVQTYSNSSHIASLQYDTKFVVIVFVIVINYNDYIFKVIVFVVVNGLYKIK